MRYENKVGFINHITKIAKDLSASFWQFVTQLSPMTILV